MARRLAVPPPEFSGSYFAADLVVRGRIRGDGDLCIDGVVDGDVVTTSVELGSTARVRATIEAENAVVSGNMAGIIKARHVAFTDGCRFEGEVQYETLGIESDASVGGVMHPVVAGDARTHVGQSVVARRLPRPDARRAPDMAKAAAAPEVVARQDGPSAVRGILKAMAALVVMAAVVVIGLHYVAPALQDMRASLSALVDQKRSPTTIEPADLTPDAPAEAESGGSAVAPSVPVVAAPDPTAVAPQPVTPVVVAPAPVTPVPVKPAATTPEPVVPAKPAAPGVAAKTPDVSAPSAVSPAVAAPAAPAAPVVVKKDPAKPSTSQSPASQSTASPAAPPPETDGPKPADDAPSAAKPAPRKAPAVTSSGGCSWVLQCEDGDKCVSVRQCTGQ